MFFVVHSSVYVSVIIENLKCKDVMWACVESHFPRLIGWCRLYKLSISDYEEL